jgi:DNA-binding response OmpR family regulator
MPPISILVIEDHEELLALLRKVLSAEGYKVVVAKNGRTADEALARGKFDLVLTDVLMPDRDGIEIVCQLSKSRPGMPVVAMSGGGQVVSAEHILNLSRSLGAKAVLEKPFSNDVLCRTIATVLRQAGGPSNVKPPGELTPVLQPAQG